LRDALKDKGQRRGCGCIVSKDIGTYDTCPHLCRYCYANSSEKAVDAAVRRQHAERDSSH
jgi:DNA repair photolyase